MNGWSLKDFAEQNEDRNQLGWQLENPMNFLVKKRRSPFFGQNPYWVYQDSAMGLQNQVKKQGSIGVEITEPIVLPISYQDLAEQNEAKAKVIYNVKNGSSFIMSKSWSKNLRNENIN